MNELHNEIFIEIRPHPLTFADDIFIYERRIDGTVAVAHAQSNGDLVMEPHTPGSAVLNPTLTLDRFLLQKLTDALVKQSGWKPKDISVAEGKLLAQTAHLEDLRHLLKLPK